MIPNHGTRARYNAPHSCRCEPCRVAGRRYRKARFLALAQGTSRLVDTTEAKRHLINAQALGISTRAVALAAGVSPTVAQDIRHGRHARVDRSTADKILAVDPRRLRPKPNARVDPTGTIRRLRALATLGWSGRAMSDRLGISHASVSRALKGAYEVNSTTRIAVRDGYRTLILTKPPTATRSERIASTKAKLRALDERWAGPLAWNDIDNDEHPETADDYAEATGPQKVAELVDMGLTRDAIAARLGINPRTVTQYARRARKANAA